MKQTESRPDFRYRHPEWLAMRARWLMAWDFWRGGVHVLDPDHDVDRARLARPVEYSAVDDASGTSSELEVPASPYEWVPYGVRGYLYKNDNETDAEFRNRLKRQVHLPIFSAVINIFVAGILKTGPRRDPAGLNREPWASLWFDTDLAKTNIDAFVRQALAMALIFGRAHAVVDEPRVTGAVVDNQADRDAAGIRPYAQLISPLDLVDWSVDDFGRFLWAVVRENDPAPRQPGTEPPGEAVSRYRVWYPDRWELWVDQSRSQYSEPSFELDDEGSHPVGRVPIETLWATRANRTADMFCESPVSDVLDFDRHLLNKLSELDEVERTQTFAVLWLPEMEGMSSGPVDISPYRALTGSAEAGPPQYVSPDWSLAAGKWERIQSELWAIRQLAGVGRGKAEYSKEERSAAAITVESEDKRNQMAIWAAATEEFDRGLHSLVCGWSGIAQDDYPEICYSRDYDLKSVTTQIQELVQLNSTNALGPEALAMLAKPIVAKMLADSGTSQETIAEIERVIDENAQQTDRTYSVTWRGDADNGRDGAGHDPDR